MILRLYFLILDVKSEKSKPKVALEISPAMRRKAVINLTLLFNGEQSVRKEEKSKPVFHASESTSTVDRSRTHHSKRLYPKDNWSKCVKWIHGWTLYASSENT